jgi:hypothetical protein
MPNNTKKNKNIKVLPENFPTLGLNFVPNNQITHYSPSKFTKSTKPTNSPLYRPPSLALSRKHHTSHKPHNSHKQHNSTTDIFPVYMGLGVIIAAGIAIATGIAVTDLK